MQPAITPVHLVPGTTNRATLRVMQPGWVYRQITDVAPTAPVQLTVPGHGLDTDSWHAWISGVQQMPELNRQPPTERPHRVSVVDADTLRIDRISGTGKTPRGTAMELRYMPPVDLTGCDVEMRIFDKAGGSVLLTLGLGSGLTITGPGTIERVIGADVEIPAAASWYWVEVRYPDGTEHRYWEAPVTLGNP